MSQGRSSAWPGICAFGRSEQDGEDVFAPQREFLSKTYPDARIATITLPGLVDISSTQLRELLARERGSEYLLPSVYGYILMNRLYGTYPCLKRLELPELRACSYSMIRHKRVAHVMGVEEEAVKLAKFWGADPEPGPPRRDFARLYQIPGADIPVAFVREIWY